MFFSKKIELGPLKNLDDITIEDMQKYPIWINDVSGEHEEGFDESSERPVINSDDVTKKILSSYVSVSILVKCEQLNLPGSANIEEDGSISVLVFWKDGKWQPNNKFIKEDKIIIQSVPSIKGEKNIKFEYNLKDDIGSQVK